MQTKAFFYYFFLLKLVYGIIKYLNIWENLLPVKHLVTVFQHSPLTHGQMMTCTSTISHCRQTTATPHMAAKMAGLEKKNQKNQSDHDQTGHQSRTCPV